MSLNTYAASDTDPDTGKRLVLLTHCFLLDVMTVTQLYKACW